MLPNPSMPPVSGEVVRVLDTITEVSQILAAGADSDINRRNEVYPIFLRYLNTYQFVNCSFNSNFWEETHVYLRPSRYLPCQILYGKRLCRSLYPPSHHFTNLYQYMGCEWIPWSTTYLLSTQYLSRHSTSSELKRSRRRVFRWWYTGNWSPLEVFSLQFKV